ncbi:hypothetical protein [Ferruginibacter sp. HRS2-29]|uniref:hypothetical protein n=1 Tax=Ferruginibacter sp. HRS2-29 TaxID=2487334 RepID=UPI0020CC0282|nr:hypothetical protein [Ferruginibacter sp. HRS2-29]MCP9752025.1 hypothetical protein [Ferruginibacter sp. HRS2-29]
MKSYLLLFLLLSCTGTLLSQTKFGIATFNIPAGWQSTQTRSTVVLESNSRKGGTCKVTIYNSQNIVVNTAGLYQQSRNANNTGNTTYGTSLKQITKTETEDGIIGFKSAGTRLVNKKELSVYFFSFTNGNESFFVEAQTDSQECTPELNQFLLALLVDIPAGAVQGHTKAKKRKAAPACPAAPAPMM